MSVQSILLRWVLLMAVLNLACCSFDNVVNYKVLLISFICFCLKCSENTYLHWLSGMLSALQVNNIWTAVLNYSNASVTENILYKILSENSPRVTEYVMPYNLINKGSNQSYEITPIHYLANNFHALSKCILLAGVAFAVGVGCYRLYSWTFIPKQSMAESALISDLSQAVHQNRLAIHDLNTVVESVRQDTGHIIDRSNFHNRVLEFNEIIINKNNTVLMDISEIVSLTPQIINTINRLQAHDEQIGALQMQIASSIIMAHKHEMWLRSL